ncbi:cytochrome P450 [Rhodococcoides corynebacterioides]|uniref:Cytochrome P450 n=1 Tax=Rhodococcoides corynebacterioides TaxID=53972 RepID=A0ABS7P4N1_9NOCA|nr:cytochrome P450 [Rhodococcus corynebacterioides]MBY6366971.1 cytochrome P450 [Rhodococcus corynebacterioides]MBY6407773.1 cytochrome P450 [Rhodococcus corynebacterioides]
MGRGGGLVESARARVRWAAVHGVVRFFAQRGIKLGDPQAKLIADPATRADPGVVYQEIRERGPLVKGRVAYLTVDHGLIFDLLRSDDFRTVVVGGNLPGPLKVIERHTRSGALHPLAPPSLLSVEPPSHTRYRKLVSSVFTARAVNTMRDDVQRVADTLLDELVASGATTVDIVPAYCAKLPVAVISDILGVPESEQKRVLEFGELAAPSLDVGLTWPQFREVETGLQGFDAWLSDHIAELRKNPGDDLMSQLISASEDGVFLNDRELRATAGLVLAAGFETTVNLLGSGIDLLVRHPDQLARLQNDPSLWSTAVDEMLRLESPVQMTARVARKDLELAGKHLEPGSLVVCVLAGGNRDPKVFENPDRFDVGRANAGKHLSFSGGRHFCLGAALARAESEVALRTLFDRFPHLTTVGTGTRRDTRVLHGYSSLPVSLGEPATVDA